MSKNIEAIYLDEASELNENYFKIKKSTGSAFDPPGEFVFVAEIRDYKCVNSYYKKVEKEKSQE